MTSEAKPVIGSLSGGLSSWKPPATTTTGTSTFENLLDFLSFVSKEKEIPLVQKILSERDRDSAESAKREREEQSRLEIENVKLRDELKNLRREFENLTENKIRLEEEKKVLEDREKRSVERYKKVNEELLNEQSEKCKVIFELKMEIEKLKSDKNEAEKKLDAFKKRFELLDDRYLRLSKIAENRYGDWIADNGIQTAMGNCKPKMKDASSGIVASPVVLLIDSDDDDDKVPVDKEVSLAKLYGSEVLGQTEKALSPTQKSQEKKKEWLMKKKRCPRKSHEEGVSVYPQKKMCTGDLQGDRTKGYSVCVSSKSSSLGHSGMSGSLKKDGYSKGDSSVDSEDSETILESHKTKGRWPWLLESDMCLAFIDDPELCMDAVCALYRQQISLPKSLKCLDKEFDIVRVANYLIHDHPEDKLKRSVTEVSKDVIAECKRLALHYSGELFRIYCYGKDPFFCYKAMCSKF